MAGSTTSWSLPMSASGNFLVFVLLMLGWNRCGASVNSILLCNCPFEACQVVVNDGLCE
ncbi:hypothetical protein DPMN_070642 [Dreissena polymorpha]|uniref:Uncharacterized protein n=1 Tax=Dreissena polymorpha TaxID=45954 RepID=A0A9D3Z3D4_DREPO|nr:hypothetical protein DPMN_070642 [Dreissena polymorpha]